MKNENINEVTDIPSPCQQTLFSSTPPNANIHAILENIDCRDGMKQLKENSVSLVLTDPPYFIDGMGDDWNTQKLKQASKTWCHRFTTSRDEVLR